MVRIGTFHADKLGSVDERAWKRVLNALPDEMLESMCLTTLALLRTGGNYEGLT
jgi:hypothetical protein